MSDIEIRLSPYLDLPSNISERCNRSSLGFRISRDDDQQVIHQYDV